MRNTPKFVVLRHLEYRPNENINSENESYTLIQNHLVKGLEGTKEKVKEINSISTMENRENVFYVIDAQTENGNHKYIVAQYYAISNCLANQFLSKKLLCINNIR